MSYPPLEFIEVIRKQLHMVEEVRKKRVFAAMTFARSFEEVRKKRIGAENS